jgi:hypothetical protein
MPLMIWAMCDVPTCFEKEFCGAIEREAAADELRARGWSVDYHRDIYLCPKHVHWTALRTPARIPWGLYLALARATTAADDAALARGEDC